MPKGYPRGGSAAGLDRAEDRTPDRVPGLGGGQLHLRVDIEREAKLVPAAIGVARGAIDEREVLVRAHAVRIPQTKLQRRLQVLGRRGVLAVVVLAYAGRERGRALAVEGARERSPDLAYRLPRAGRQRCGHRQRNQDSNHPCSPVIRSLNETDA